MILFYFILSSFSALVYTDNCTESICSAKVTIASEIKFQNNHKSESELMSWLNDVYATGAFGPDGSHSIELVNSLEEKNKIDSLDQARSIRKFCDAVLERVIAYNLSSGFTSAQLDTMTVNFSGVLSLLQNYRPWSAKTAIAALTPDAFVTQEFKDELIQMFTDAGY